MDISNETFKPLNEDEYLALLAIVNNSENDEDRKIAKERLLLAHVRLIQKVIKKRLNQTTFGEGIGIDSASDLLISMAGQMFAEMSEMAAASRAAEAPKLSAIIAHRVTLAMADKLRQKNALKRSAKFESAEEILDYCGETRDPADPIVIVETLCELEKAMVEFNETEQLVFKAVLYGFETGQDISVAGIAVALDKSPNTVRSAYASAKEKIRKNFPEF